MTKAQFLDALRQRLAYLPEAETAKPIAFYAESIDDRVEDGMTEEEAVAALGSIDDIAREIEAALPLATVVKQRVRSDRARAERSGHSGVLIALAAAGFPVWLPLLIVALVLVIVVYVVVWSVILSLFAALLSLIAAAVVLLIHSVVNIATLGIYGALMAVGGALMIFGLAILLEKPVRALAKALAKLTGRFWRWLKGRISRGGGEE